MVKYSNRFRQAIEAFDQLNSKDPNEAFFKGKKYPKELLYAQRMTERLQLFEPNASEALQLAARCQHICRWKIPRETYPLGRKGYHQWRNKLKIFHADLATEVLKEVGYDNQIIERVQSLVLKKQFKKDITSQTLEDVICLVFLEHYFPAFAAKHPTAKVIDIIRKTWAKMSERGQKAALTLPLADDMKAIVQSALEKEKE